jgi:hypothetical protein
VSLPDHPGLLSVLWVVDDPSGGRWVVVPYRSGSGLDRRIERVGRVDPATSSGEGAAVARALAALHDDGLVHGDLGAHRVLLGSRDEVVLDATCARPGSPSLQDADLQAFGDLLESICGGSDASVLRVVAAARSGEAATALAEALDRGRAVPARRTARHARRARAGRALVVGATGAVSLVAASALGVRLAARPAEAGALAGQEPIAVEERVAPAVPTAPDPSESSAAPERTGPAPTAEPEAPDWVTVLGGLDRARGSAFAAADPALLSAADVEGGEAYVRDLALVDALRRGRAVAEGWATRLVSVTERSRSGSRAELLVTDRLAAYVLRGEGGEVVDRRAGRGERRWVVHLASTADGWRIERVEQAT